MRHHSRLLALVGTLGVVVAGLALVPAPAPAVVGPSEPILTLKAPPAVTIESYGRNTYFDPGVRLVAGEDPVEIWSTRATYNDPVMSEIRYDGGSSLALPADMVPKLESLPGFFRMIVRNSDGVPVVDRYRSLCLNNWDAQRSRPSAPPRSPYPYGCEANDFSVGAVQGLQAGWSTPALGYTRLRLAPGQYDVEIKVADRYAPYFGLSGDDQTKHVAVTVVEGGGDGGCCIVKRQGQANAHNTKAKPRGNTTAPTGPAGARLSSFDGPKPDLQALPAFGMTLSPNGKWLRFSATVWNGGESPMVVDGFREDTSDETMDAYQYFFNEDGDQLGYEQVGEMEWHNAPTHMHWHFLDFASYDLLAGDKSHIVKSRKESFCLANTDAVDYTLEYADWRPDGTDLGSVCGGFEALTIQEVLSVGSGDTYAQYRAGQAFYIGNLPVGTYYIAVTANPEGRLIEGDYDNNVSYRRIRILGPPDNRRIKVPQVGVIKETQDPYKGGGGIGRPPME